MNARGDQISEEENNKKDTREEKEKIVLHNSLSSGPPSGCNIFFFLFRRVSKSGAAVTAEKVEIFECSLFDKSVAVARAFR